MVTIGDIARRAGISKGAVSYALNGKPGVSDETRQRVRALAEEMGWTPNSAARSLTRRRADAIGLVIHRPPKMLGAEPFYMTLIAGIEEAIAPGNIGLMFQLVQSREAEIIAYKKWWSERRVDGFLVVDMSRGDERLTALRDAQIPAVLLADSETADGHPHVWSEERQPMLDAVRYLVRLGHTRIAHVGGNPASAHAQLRQAAYREALDEAALESVGEELTDYSGEAGSRATRSLLTRPNPPTAIVYDNDIMAVAGLAVAAELGIEVPRELSLIAWNDSPLCEVTHPPLSAMSRDIGELGRMAAQSLLDLIRNGTTTDREGPRTVLTPRGTTSTPG